jgi:hypothetical protein
MTSSQHLTLGLLPDKKLDWRKFVLSYGIVLALTLILLVSHLIWPERMSLWDKYTVTEIIPRPDLVPEKPIIKRPPKITKLLPAVKFETPKLIVPKDVRQPKPVEAEVVPPKIQPVNFEAPKIMPVSGAMPTQVIHTGSFGSSATPTVNAPIQKVQTGGFGDPNGLPGEGKQGAKLTAAKLGSFDLPEGAGTGNGTGGAKGIKGTIASAGFGNGIAQPGQGDGRSAAEQIDGELEQAHRGIPDGFRPSPGVVAGMRTVTRRQKDAFADALASAERGISPARLREESGMGRTWIHQMLAALAGQDAVTQLRRGLYAPLPGTDIHAAVELVEAGNDQLLREARRSLHAVR